MLVAVAVAVDALLFLKAGGALLRPIEAVGLAIAAAAAIALVRWAPRPTLLVTPVVGFVMFRLSLVTLIHVPDDAAIRDAQAGLAILVIVGAQLAVVASALVLSQRD